MSEFSGRPEDRGAMQSHVTGPTLTPAERPVLDLAKKFISQSVAATAMLFGCWYGGWALLSWTGRVSVPPHRGWWDLALLAVAFCLALEASKDALEAREKSTGKKVFWGPYRRTAALGAIFGSVALAIIIRAGWLAPLDNPGETLILTGMFALAGAFGWIITRATRQRDYPLASVADVGMGLVAGAIVSAFAYFLWLTITKSFYVESTWFAWLAIFSGTGAFANFWRKRPAAEGSERGRLSLSGLIGGAADAANRSRTLIVGLWFSALGLVLLWFCGPYLIAALTNRASAPIQLIWSAVGAAIGAYLLFARGLEPILSALSWSSISTDTHGKARTATESELRQAGLMPRRDAIYLGQFLDSFQQRDAMGYPGRVHLVTIGPPGSGKGTGLIIPNLSELRRSILIIDPKGEAAAITARKRAQFGRVVMLNPFNVLTKERPRLKSSGFNPLATLDKTSSHFVDDATGIAEALVRIEGNDPHWSASAQDLIAALVMYEVISNGRAANLGNVRKLVTEPLAVKDGEPIGLVATLEKMQAIDYQPLKAKIGKFLTPSPEVRSIVSAAGTQTRFLDSPLIVDDLASTNAFSFADMKKEIVTVYLILPATHLESHSNWLRLMIVSALRELLATPPSRKLPPVLFMLDEFAQLGHLPAISNAMNIARGFGVQLWPFVQDLNQLHSIYKDNWQNFIGARGALTSFAPHDLFTARYLSDLCGNKTVIVESENERTGSAGMGRGRGPQGLPLFRPEELMAMTSGQMLCFVDPVKNPIMARASGYWETDFMQGLDSNPYHQSS